MSERPSNAHVFVSVSQACPCQHLYFSNPNGWNHLFLATWLYQQARLVWNIGTANVSALRYRVSSYIESFINRLTPNDPYMGRTAPLTSKRCILYIYSTNIGTRYFKHALYSPFFSLQNAVCFIMLTCLVPVLFTFYIQGVLKLKK